MTGISPKGRVYRCELCGAELVVLGDAMGRFNPVCCDRAMEARDERVVFYVCDLCGAEIAVLKAGEGEFLPNCCDEPMRLAA